MDNAGFYPLANKNFNHIKTNMGCSPDRPQPSTGRATKGATLAGIDRKPPLARLGGSACLDLDEDQDHPLEDHEVELIPAATPVPG
jgi:hypothetical protein